METYWETAMYAFSAVDLILKGWLLYVLAKPFLPGCRHAARVGATYAAVMLFLKFCPWFLMAGPVAYAIGVTAAFLVMRLLHPGNTEQKIFLSVLFYLLEWISSGCTTIPWTALFHLLVYPAGAAGRLWLQFWLYVGVQIGSRALEAFLLYMLIRLVHRAYVFKRENMTKKELSLVLAPALLAVAGRLVFLCFFNLYEQDTGQSFASLYEEYDWMLLLYHLLSFAALMAVIVIYQSIKNGQRREKEDALLALQIEGMERHMNAVEQLYAEIRGIKHDIGSHVMTLEGLSKRDSESERYVEALKSQVNGAIADMRSGNPITDVILREKQREAQQNGVAFLNAFHYPVGAGVNAFDVSVILNNALSNAMEAAGECEKPYISVASHYKKNAYLIEVKNSVKGVRAVDEESGLPMTTKAGGGHGFGLTNIRKVAQKYYGDVDVTQDGNEFALCVLLMLERE